MISEQFTIAGVNTLIDILRTYSNHTLEFVRPIYERSRGHFEETVQGAIDLGLLRLQEDELALIGHMALASQQCASNEPIRNKLLDCVLRSLLDSQGLVSDEVAALWERFEIVDNMYLWRPKTAEIPQFVGIRNVFLELGVINYDFIREGYVLSAAFVEQFIRISKRRHISPEQLRLAVDGQLEIGTKAELAVIAFEKAALAGFPELASKIMHVAAEDAAAGFDVLSYEQPSGHGNKAVEKYIEVKAVSLVGWRFYWSRTEVETAKRLSVNYYLYLVPVVHQGLPSVLDMQVIKNPYEELLGCQSRWAYSCESFQFWLKENS